MVILDGSGSIGRCEFGKGKKALKQVMKLAENNPTVDTKYAAVSYSNIKVGLLLPIQWPQARWRVSCVPQGACLLTRGEWLLSHQLHRGLGGRL